MLPGDLLGQRPESDDGALPAAAECAGRPAEDLASLIGVIERVPDPAGLLARRRR